MPPLLEKKKTSKKHSQRSESVRSAVLNKRDNLDDVMEEIGGCSHFQLRRHVLFFLLSIPFACQNLLLVFAGQNPGMCYQQNVTHCIDVKELPEKYTCPITSNHKFLKNADFSIVTEFGLVCDRGYLEQIANSAYFVGAVIGSFIIGWIADKFGRKSVLFCCLAVVTLISGMTAIAKTLWFFVMARFLIGFFMAGFALALYVIALEMVSPSFRSLACTFLLNYFAVALMILALKAYLLQNWRHLMLVGTLPYVILLLFYRVVPESLRWLWSTGQYKKANATIERIATENKKAERLAHFSDVIAVDSYETSFCNYLHIFKNQKLIIYSTVMSYSSLVVGVAYYGFFLVSKNLSGDVYLDFTLLALMEIPANFLSTFATTKIGRKKTVILSLLIVSLSNASLFFITKSDKLDLAFVKLGIALFGKIFLSTGLVSSDIWSCELYPTTARTKGLGLLTGVRVFGGAIAPWLTTFLSDSSPALPFGIMSIAVGLAGLMLMILPETKGQKTRDTFDDLKSECDDDVDESNNKTSLTELKDDYVPISDLERETIV